MRLSPIALVAFAAAVFIGPLQAGSTPPLVCASGGAIATIDLRVSSPSPRHTAQPLPLRTISRLEEGDTVQYKPILRPNEARKGEVTLVLVPSNKKAAGRDTVLIFDPKPANRAQQWNVPWRTSLVAFVYGASGLNVKKVQSFLNKDDELIGELADYADKTAKSEALIAALTSPDSSRETVNAALDGFSSRYTTAAPLTRTAPVNQQATVAFQTLHSSIASYDPLAGQGSQPVNQTAGLATSVAEMFFGTPVGLAAGGTAVLMNLEAIAFPKSEFRSAYSQAMPGDTLGLCGKTGAPVVHTRVDYLWAVRIPNADRPRLSIGKANSLPAGEKSPLPLTALKSPAKAKSPAASPNDEDTKAAEGSSPEDDWKFLSHARSWVLQPAEGKPIPVKVEVLANTKSIELDLGKTVKPGRYELSANWDWDQFQVSGDVDVRPLPDFAAAKLTPSAQDRLIANAGKLPLTLEGADFEFVTKVEIKKLNDEFATSSAVPFVLSKGLRAGLQDHMNIQLEAGGMEVGQYKLMISQIDGKSHDVPLKVLPALPVISNLPVTVNQGATTLRVDLKGTGLQLLKSLQTSKGSATLGGASADGTLRHVTFLLPSGMKAGGELSLQAALADRSQVLNLGQAIRVVAPRPEIAQISMSSLPAQAVHLDDGELPGEQVINVMLYVRNLPADNGIKLECDSPGSESVTLRPGQQSGGAKLEQLSSDQLFLTLDTGTWMNGCSLQAVITSHVGDSAPHRIARIVDLPVMNRLELSPAESSQQVHAMLTGRNLERIERVSWAPDRETVVATLPQPISDGLQRLDLSLQALPSPESTLYVWLRGDAKARTTTIHAIANQ